jgi:hypothetical protein
MKRIIVFLILVVVFSCKDEKKKETEVVVEEIFEKQYEIVKNFTHLDLLNWSKVRVNAEPVLNKELQDVTYNLSRITSTESAYLSSDLIPVTYASEYKVSVMAKKGDNNSFFGLRITGIYPDRVDAIFDLDEGIVVEYSAAQDFESPMATIEKLSNGWYNCTLSAKVAADQVRIIMGETSKEKNASNWEGKTETMGGIYFLPSSIVLKELK